MPGAMAASLVVNDSDDFFLVCLFHASKQLRYLTKTNRIQLNEHEECRSRMALGRKQPESVPKDLLRLGASQWPSVTKSETEIQLLGGSRAALALTCGRAFSTAPHTCLWKAQLCG